MSLPQPNPNNAIFQNLLIFAREKLPRSMPKTNRKKLRPSLASLSCTSLALRVNLERWTSGPLALVEAFSLVWVRDIGGQLMPIQLYFTRTVVCKQIKLEGNCGWRMLCHFWDYFVQYQHSDCDITGFTVKHISKRECELNSTISFSLKPSKHDD